jgi:hypothetical protein
MPWKQDIVTSTPRPFVGYRSIIYCSSLGPALDENENILGQALKESFQDGIVMRDEVGTRAAQYPWSPDPIHFH